MVWLCVCVCVCECLKEQSMLVGYAHIHRVSTHRKSGLVTHDRPSITKTNHPLHAPHQHLVTITQSLQPNTQTNT